jgi:hypothetical protein
MGRPFLRAALSVVVAVHCPVRQHQHIRPTRQMMRCRPIPSQLDPVLSRFAIQKSGPDHHASRIAFGTSTKGSKTRLLNASGYM